MSELVTREYYGVPGWAWVLTGVGAIVGIVWLAYEYFIAPGEVILNQYKAILEDIYRENKTFLETNEANGIYGLTADQERILAAKQDAAEYLRPQVERILTERGQQMWGWLETIIIGVLIIYGIKEVVPDLIAAVKKWHAEKTEASEKMASQYGHSHLIFELVANEYAYAGKLGIASAFYNANIPSIYAQFTEPGLNMEIAYYNALLPTLPPGTIEYLVAQQMLSYLSYEISATTGIMPVLHTWWVPPLI